MNDEDAAGCGDDRELLAAPIEFNDLIIPEQVASEVSGAPGCGGRVDDVESPGVHSVDPRPNQRVEE